MYFRIQYWVSSSEMEVTSSLECHSFLSVAGWFLPLKSAPNSSMKSCRIIIPTAHNTLLSNVRCPNQLYKVLLETFILLDSSLILISWRRTARSRISPAHSSILIVNKIIIINYPKILYYLFRIIGFPRHHPNGKYPCKIQVGHLELCRLNK